MKCVVAELKNSIAENNETVYNPNNAWQLKLLLETNTMKPSIEYLLNYYMICVTLTSWSRHKVVELHIMNYNHF